MLARHRGNGPIRDTTRPSKLKLLHLHPTTNTSLGAHPSLIHNRPPPLMHVLLHGTPCGQVLPEPRVPAAEAARPAPERVGARLLLEVQQPVAELVLLALLLGGLAPRELGVQGLRGPPLLPEGELLHLVPQEEHHVVPVRLVRVRAGQVWEEVLVAELGCWSGG